MADDFMVSFDNIFGCSLLLNGPISNELIIAIQ